MAVKHHRSNISFEKKKLAGFVVEERDKIEEDGYVIDGDFMHDGKKYLMYVATRLGKK